MMRGFDEDGCSLLSNTLIGLGFARAYIQGAEVR